MLRDVKGVVGYTLDGSTIIGNHGVYLPMGIITSDNTVTLEAWKADDGMRAFAWRGPWPCVLSSDGNRIVSTDSTGLLTVYDSVSGYEVFRMRAKTSDITDLSLSPNGRRLVSASKSGSLTMWEVAAGWEKAPEEKVEGPPEELAAKRLEANVRRALAVDDFGQEAGGYLGVLFLYSCAVSLLSLFWILLAIAGTDVRYRLPTPSHYTVYLLVAGLALLGGGIVIQAGWRVASALSKVLYGFPGEGEWWLPHIVLLPLLVAWAFLPVWAFAKLVPASCPNCLKERAYKRGYWPGYYACRSCGYTRRASITGRGGKSS